MMILLAQPCDDGLQNGDESDVDCGGTCAGCDDGSACGLDTDCDSGLCEAGACVAVCWHRVVTTEFKTEMKSG